MSGPDLHALANASMHETAKFRRDLQPVLPTGACPWCEKVKPLTSQGQGEDAQGNVCVIAICDDCHDEGEFE